MEQIIAKLLSPDSETVQKVNSNFLFFFVLHLKSQFLAIGENSNQ